MANPAFGSPAWDAKYGVKRFGGKGGAAPAASKPPVAPRSSGRGRPGAPTRQPSLTSVISGLEGAISTEPEANDKKELESALATVKRVAQKNSTEE